MPINEKGKKILGRMESDYGSKKAGEKVFYASKNAGTIKGVEGKSAPKKAAKKKK